MRSKERPTNLKTTVAYDPSWTLKLATYQAIICALFASFKASVCIEYDWLFRHQASRDEPLRWDTLKEDLFLFQTANVQKTPFQRVFSRLGLQPDQPTCKTHTPGGSELCRHFNYSKCSLGDSCHFTNRCSVRDCGGAHPAKGHPQH